ncbi:conjugative transposon protein TraM [Barnesiella intestinihominis]|uniref:conjugative transposon protein TraM n=1 Tax=Barnesiella intestinihominis TaxID=487174 RepID=UPI00189BAF93|nr:conjugative transposon protein TraM [Barnesiella intestinihominis]MDB0674549.1 conjugative transposon protein TraM [Barnesiella intestinihominis]
MSNDANALKRKEQIKKILVYGGMVMLCLVSFYFIFKPSKEQVQAEQQKVGFNAELPDPRGAGIEADKIAAYELEDMRVKQEQKMRTLEDFTAMTTDDEEEEVVEIPEEPRYTGGGGGSSYRGGSSSRSNSFSTSTSAYNDINATLGSFYEQPREDPEKEALKAELEELKQSMAQQQNSQPTYADQVALLEKSYELAAKYMPGNATSTSEGAAEEVETTTRNGKAKAQPVGHVTTPVVSALAQPVSDSVMIARMAQSVGGGFHTAVGEAPKQAARNTIKACVHGDQTIISGQSVRLRLLEAMRVGKYVLPRNTLITGEGSIKGERLDIEILQVEHNGTIIPVELTVHDNDGQAGIFIPGSMEASAAKEMAANLGQNLGTSISITNQSAGDQLLSEVGRGAIQGVSQYISKKMREEKVHLKSGYTLMLYQNNQ